jgi:hypothetical protein
MMSREKESEIGNLGTVQIEHSFADA